jgi:Na+/melibiose symporter-like transporter
LLHLGVSLRVIPMEKIAFCFVVGIGSYIFCFLYKWYSFIHQKKRKGKKKLTQICISHKENRVSITLPGFAIIFSCGFNIIWICKNQYHWRNLEQRTKKEWHKLGIIIIHTWTIWASPPRIWKGITAPWWLYITLSLMRLFSVCNITKLKYRLPTTKEAI